MLKKNSIVVKVSKEKKTVVKIREEIIDKSMEIANQIRNQWRKLRNRQNVRNKER
jgi:hypothetical protein